MHKNVKIAIGSDHAGFHIKKSVIEYFNNKEGYEIKDFGTYSDKISDYPDYAHAVADEVEKGNHKFGIVICGSGNGVNMTANKHQGIRSALCWNREVAGIVRKHNDANICALPGRFVSGTEAIEIVEEFMNTGFEGGRHLIRVNKINPLVNR